jgi:Microsomal signal peptidase 25 kDa subunit (SPC25)
VRLFSAHDSSVSVIFDLRYIILTLSQAIYAYLIEGDIIFVGKRKTFDKRVREHCDAASHCIADIL